MNKSKVIFFLTVTLAVLFASAGFSFAQNTKVQESKKARLEKEIKEIDRQLKALAADRSNAMNELTLVRQKISTRREYIAECEREIEGLENEIALKEHLTDSLQNRFAVMSDSYAKLLRAAYRTNDSRVWYLYIFSSEDVVQAIRRIGYFKSMTERLNAQGVRALELKQQLADEMVLLGVMKDSAVAARAQHQAELQTLQSEEAASKQLMTQLDKDKAKYQGQIADKRKQIEALNREIQRIIREAMEAERKRAEKAKKNGKPVDYTLGGAFASNKGKLPWPVDGVVVETFGQHPHPVYKNVMMPPNNGVTLSTAKNATVKAVYDGEVRQIAVMAGNNQCVLVSHGNYFTLYCKMGTVSVKAGDKVKTGQQLGTVDTIAGETQFHFEIWTGNQPQNPSLWLRPR